MAKKKSGASKGAKKVRPFDDMNTDDARGKAIDKILKEIENDIKKDQFFNDPQSPRA